MSKKKKTKYRKISFKLTDRQKKSLDAYCRELGTTPVQFIKATIKPALNGNPPDPSLKRREKRTSKQIDLEELIQQISEEEQGTYESKKKDNPRDLFS